LLAQFRIVDSGATKTVRALAFSCDFINSDCGGWFGAHTWSLSAEEQFYLVVPILFVLVKQRWLLTSFVCSLGTAALVMYALRWGDAAYVAIEFVTIGLGVGAALNEAKVREWAERTPTWLVALALVVIVAIWSIPLDKALIFRVPRSALANVARILILDPLVVFVLMATTFKPSPLRAVLASWPLRTFGVVSYSFYLWQQLATAPWPGATVWFYAASILLCGAFSFASYRWFESPLIAVGGRLARRLSRKGVTAPLAGGPATTATSAPVASSPNGVDGR
jgi:peptidoglycan/LPS O-acetylase OafA/YrhL